LEGAERRPGTTGKGHPPQLRKKEKIRKKGRLRGKNPKKVGGGCGLGLRLKG